MLDTKYNHLDVEKDKFNYWKEKGYFEFGGSTVVLLTGPEVLVDERLEAALQEKTEVHVRMGEPIGKERA